MDPDVRLARSSDESSSAGDSKMPIAATQSEVGGGEEGRIVTSVKRRVDDDDAFPRSSLLQFIDRSMHFIENLCKIDSLNDSRSSCKALRWFERSINLHQTRAFAHAFAAFQVSRIESSNRRIKL